MAKVFVFGRGKSVHATKRGPGRRSISKVMGEHAIKPRDRYSPRGGNWQGKDYLNLAEHDRCVMSLDGYEVERKRIIEARK